MSGTKGCSGGRRAGAGRPVKRINVGRHFVLKTGQQVTLKRLKDKVEQKDKVRLEVNRSEQGYELNLVFDDGQVFTISAAC